MPPRVKAILEEVAAETAVPVYAIIGPSRRPKATDARRLAMGRVRALVGPHGGPAFSYPQIGRFFGGRDHTTVINAVRRYQAEVRL